LNLPYNFVKGRLNTDTVIGQNIQKFLQDPSLYTIVSGGNLYISGLLNTLTLFRLNIQNFAMSINVYTSMASSYIIKNRNSNLSIINELFAEKLGFKNKDYNYYMNDTYYDYNKNHDNSFALQLIRVNAILIFIWNLIYYQTTFQNIKIDYPFSIQFYLSIFENLNGTNPILTDQINPFFTSYSPVLLPSNYDKILTKWIYFIGKEKNLVSLLILKQSSRLLSYDELVNNFPTDLTLKLSRSAIKDRMNEVFIYRNSFYQNTINNDKHEY